MKDNFSHGNEIKISVIMPVFNSGKFLSDAVNSILNQTFKNFELLAIYDPSSDDSLEILQNYCALDSRLKIINSDNSGIVSALNKGLALAKGEFIARMDADDISEPSRFAKQLDALEFCRADICGSHWFVINEAGKTVDVKLAALEPLSIPLCLSYTVPFAHGGVMIRSSFLRFKNLKYRKKYLPEDYDLWTRCFNDGAKFINVDDYLFKYRQHSTSNTTKTIAFNLRDMAILRKKFIALHNELYKKILDTISNEKHGLTRWEEVLVILLAIHLIIHKRIFRYLKIVVKSPKRSIAIALLYYING